LDETFRNSSFIYLEYKWKCKTIIKNDQHKEIRSYRYWVKCYAFINSNIVEQEGKEPQFNKSSLVRVPIRLGRTPLLLAKSPKKILIECAML
jgi:hypothetical protein